ncbi:MAG: hypothetical protein ACRD5K_12175 [Candidatus Acidiferrales bacterium]
MSKPIVFISCGQFTEAEKELGKNIAGLVESFGFQPFFAENVQDLDGLDANILRALRDCAAFITVLHPRGIIERPDGPRVVRASVWIEQEIAVAAYIKRVENRDIPLIAFAHESVSREGIRELLQINPIIFKSESEVLVKLPVRLQNLGVSETPGVQLRFESAPVRSEDGHKIRRFAVTLFNGTNTRITTYDGKLWVPLPFLAHWNAIYACEDKSSATSTHRCFRFSEDARGAINPQGSMPPLTIEYCTQCALDAGNSAQSVSEMEFEAKAWANSRGYSLKASLIQFRDASCG